MFDVIRQIAGMPLFTGLSKAQYEALARICVRRSCRKGERLFSEGDEGTGFYMVVTGRVKISRWGRPGQIRCFAHPSLRTKKRPGHC